MENNMDLKPLKLKERLDSLKNNPRALFLFCRDVLKAPWPEAEPYILKDPKIAMHYAYYVKKKLWPELENILQGEDISIYNWNMRYFHY